MHRMTQSDMMPGHTVRLNRIKILSLWGSEVKSVEKAEADEVKERGQAVQDRLDEPGELRPD